MSVKIRSLDVYLDKKKALNMLGNDGPNTSQQEHEQRPGWKLYKVGIIIAALPTTTVTASLPPVEFVVWVEFVQN